jgi:hypothetical protein
LWEELPPSSHGSLTPRNPGGYDVALGSEVTDYFIAELVGMEFGAFAELATRCDRFRGIECVTPKLARLAYPQEARGAIQGYACAKRLIAAIKSLD